LQKGTLNFIFLSNKSLNNDLLVYSGVLWTGLKLCGLV